MKSLLISMLYVTVTLFLISVSFQVQSFFVPEYASAAGSRDRGHAQGHRGQKGKWDKKKKSKSRYGRPTKRSKSHNGAKGRDIRVRSAGSNKQRHSVGSSVIKKPNNNTKKRFRNLKEKSPSTVKRLDVRKKTNANVRTNTRKQLNNFKKKHPKVMKGIKNSRRGMKAENMIPEDRETRVKKLKTKYPFTTQKLHKMRNVFQGQTSQQRDNKFNKLRAKYPALGKDWEKIIANRKSMQGLKGDEKRKKLLNIEKKFSEKSRKRREKFKDKWRSATQEDRQKFCTRAGKSCNSLSRSGQYSAKVCNFVAETCGGA